MRVVLLLSIAFGSCALSAQDYVPFPDSTATWNIQTGSYEGNWFWYEFDSYRIQGDTLLDTLFYSLLYKRPTGLYIYVEGAPNYESYNTSSPYELIGAIREDSTRKVWYKNFSEDWNDSQDGFFTSGVYDSTDVLLFDFALELGDSMLFPGAVNQYLYVTGYETIDGNLSIIFDEWNYVWIQGLGGMSGGPFSRFTQDPMNVSGVVTYLNCVTVNGEAIYGSNGLYNCDGFINSISEHEIQKLDIYPNPTTGLIHIQLPEGVFEGQLEVLTLHGELLSTEMIRGPIHRSNLGGYARGVYLLRLLTDEGVYFSKVQKE